jgi:hypothetical protein
MARHKPDTFTFHVGVHTIRGIRTGGRWRFSCPSWPALAEAHAGAESPEPIVTEFMLRALGAEPELAAAALSLADR